MGNYNDEFKKKIVRLHLENGQSLKSLSDEYNVSKSGISNWGLSSTAKNAKTIQLQKKNMIL